MENLEAEPKLELETAGSSPSSGAKGDAEPKVIPTHDDKGVAYYERFREAERKLKDYEGIDLDKIKSYEGVDLDDLKEAAELRDRLLSDKGKFQKILEILDKETGDEDNASGNDEKIDEKSSKNPEIAQLLKVVSDLKSRLDQRDQESLQKATADWMEEYDNSIKNSVDQKLKSDDYKSLEKLTADEMDILTSLVDAKFRDDRASKHPKLSLKDVDAIVGQAIAKIKSIRIGAIAGTVKKNDGSPAPLGGGGSSGEKKPDLSTKEARVASIVSQLGAEST